MTKQKHTKAVSAASKAEELLPLEQMMSQGSAPNEGASHTVDDTHQVTDSEHQGTEGAMSALMPKLRFAGFTEPWKEVCLGDIAYFEHSICTASYYVSTENMLPDFQGVSFTVENMANLSQHPSQWWSCEISGVKYEPNDVLISNIRPYLKKVWLADVSGCCSHDVLVLKLINNQKISSRFLFYVLASNWFIAYVMQAVKGSKMPRGDKGHMLQARFAVPYVLKKSMLEQMFPREGESVPRLRFAGFTEPWKTESFEQVFSYLPQINTSRDQLSVSNGYVKTIHYGDILTLFGEVLDVSSGTVPRITDSKPLDRNSPYLLRDGDILIVNTAEDSLAGKALEVVGISEEQVVGGLCTIPCRPQCMFAKPFLGYLLNAPYFRGMCVSLLQGTKVFHINKELLASVVVCYPIDMAEQQRIGAFFKALDQRIAQQRAKFDKLGQLKKALLEQMFV